MPFDSMPERIPPAALVLDRAADLVERGWCRFALAKSRFGFRAISTSNTEARRFCATGALYRAATELGLVRATAIAQLAIGGIAAEAGYTAITAWNDHSWSRRRVVSGLEEARDRVIAADRLARSPGDSDPGCAGRVGASCREMVTA